MNSRKIKKNKIVLINSTFIYSCQKSFSYGISYQVYHRYTPNGLVSGLLVISRFLGETKKKIIKLWSYKHEREWNMHTGIGYEISMNFPARNPLKSDRSGLLMVSKCKDIGHIHFITFDRPLFCNLLSRNDDLFVVCRLSSKNPLHLFITQ